MREIKFRAWHFKLNKMFSAEEMTQDQMALLPDGHFANIHGGDTSKSTIYPHTSMMPLQFTGLHDRNMKEIYEGDKYLWKGEKGVIVWDRGSFWCKPESPYNAIWDRLYLFIDEIEVTGNIYESTIIT